MFLICAPITDTTGQLPESQVAELVALEVCPALNKCGLRTPIPAD